MAHDACTTTILMPLLSQLSSTFIDCGVLERKYLVHQRKIAI
jgi:hypothetical protein